ncbi:MAG: ABC transporter ATP-binding protein [Pseudomonadota bacterium]
MTIVLECQGIFKVFGGLQALSDINLRVEEGPILGIIGPNGAGKTTLFNIIAGELSPTAGGVMFQGRKITGLGTDRICRLGVSRTYQTPRPFSSLTAMENVLVGVCFGRTGTPHRRRGVSFAMAELEFVGLAAKADQPAGSLNLEEKKRLEIARALGTDPKVILLDEIFAGLSRDETGRVVEIVRDIQRRGITVIMIEHVMRVVMELCRSVFVLSFGMKLAQGNPAEVVKDRRVVEAYLGGESLGL